MKVQNGIPTGMRPLCLFHQKAYEMYYITKSVIKDVKFIQEKNVAD